MLPDQKFSPPEAANYLWETHRIRRTASTLNKLRCLGGGPVFQRAGRSIVYERSALDAWATAMTSVPMRSTSEGGAR